MDVVKHCLHHGPLGLEQLYKRLVPRHKNKLGYRYECHACRLISGNKSNKRTRKKYKRISIEQLKPYYVRDRLAQNGFKREDITPELIAAKSAMLLLHRAIRQRTKKDAKEQA